MTDASGRPCLNFSLMRGLQPQQFILVSLRRWLAPCKMRGLQLQIHLQAVTSLTFGPAAQELYFTEPSHTGCASMSDQIAEHEHISSVMQDS